MAGSTQSRTRLSRRQKQILDFICYSVQTRGFPPSIREIGEAVGLSSSSTVHSHLRTLETKGYVRRNPSKPRSIEILDGAKGHQSRGIVDCPVGEHQGEPDADVQRLPLPLELVEDADAFLYPVRSENLRDRAIIPGDLLIVSRRVVEDRRGDLLLAREGGVERLQVASSGTLQQNGRPESGKVVVGRVLGLIRRFPPE